MYSNRSFIGCRRKSGYSFEHPGKMMNTGVTQTFADLGNGQVVLTNQFLGSPHFQVNPIIYRAGADLLHGYSVWREL